MSIHQVPVMCWGPGMQQQHHSVLPLKKDLSAYVLLSDPGSDPVSAAY